MQEEVARAHAAAPVFAIELAGEPARAALGRGRGYLLAVFRRSFYREDAEGRLVCIGSPSIGAGPLNAIARIPEGRGWERDELRPGAPADCDGDVLRVGDRLAFTLGRMRRWRPRPVPEAWSVSALATGLAALAASARARAPREGLAPLVPALAAGDHAVLPDAPLLCAAAPAAAALSAWLRAALRGREHIALSRGATAAPGFPERRAGEVRGGRRPPRLNRSGTPGAPHVPRGAPIAQALPAGAERLIGLGPGLTPAGDDLLGGAMVALATLGHAAAARRLADHVLPLARERTHAISAAHLACAAGGEGMAALHDTLACVASPGAPGLEARLDSLAAIGHTSGWDALAGAVLVIAALLGTPRPGAALEPVVIA